MTFKNYSHNVQSTVSEVKDNACTRGPSLSIRDLALQLNTALFISFMQESHLPCERADLVLIAL